MFKNIRPLYASTALACLMLISAPAQATTSTVLDFEPANLTGLYFAGDSFEQAGYRFSTMLDAGTIDTAAALGAAAPTLNATQFYTALNESGLHMERSDGNLFSLHGFDLAFVPLTPPASSGPTVILMAVATYQDNSSDWNAWYLNSTSFLTLNNPGHFAYATDVKSIDFFACSFDGVSICGESLQNNGQFAIDNISVSAVPEPSVGLMLGLGLAALTLRRRSWTR
ncbi:NF038120 family PEP-CTERM protein [Roseateles albus]|uniref:NF038120 family PEP-CTERM protein n=1 Tax=Roseateles albus TaxID=2987525 RepID=A0ABT5K8F9_9BURK|nr:NF038120 family PEP-CTERM protein [Roseateles albus]MDC8770227.1 NF038120 family PEP-CTERM protein [Roseateles albus]